MLKIPMKKFKIFKSIRMSSMLPLSYPMQLLHKFPFFLGLKNWLLLQYVAKAYFSSFSLDLIHPAP